MVRCWDTGFFLTSPGLKQESILTNLYKMTNKSKHKGPEVLSAAEAKRHFAESLRNVDEVDVIVITRYDKPGAALVGPEDLAQLESLKSQVPEEGLAQLVHRWKDSRYLSDALDEVASNRSEGRVAPQLD